MTEKKYSPSSLEPHWQKYWDESGLFRCPDKSDLPKFYCLVMFPYPSGALHVGHGRNYIIGDVVARYMKMRGFNVLSPMGWDSFGLPAENAAIKSGTHPRIAVARNIEMMKRQIQSLGIGYDWDRELATSDPDYYKWTQWVFLKLYERGLAYGRDAPVNWCPDCQTALANEEVVNGACERCGAVVTLKDLPQWFFKITDYSQRLLDDLEMLGEWPERVRKMQSDWIGRSEGALVEFKLAHTGDSLPCFTTRPDTLWGVTYMSLAPEHPIIADLVRGTDREDEVLDFAAKAREQNVVERFSGVVEKEGVFTGRYVINPVNGEEVPLWVANYALMEYGTGVVMAVPAHDQRDFEFARQYDLPVKVVIQPEGETLAPESMEAAYVDEGIMVDSGPFTGVPNREGIPRVIEYLARKGMGSREVNYRLRDWLISRQRYWGAPIPIVHCDACGTVPVPEEQLPVELPEVVDFTPRGKSPLAFVEEFVNTTCPACGGPARRETDTIAQWLCSCWYFLRFISPHTDEAPFDRELVDAWMPVDQYIGGVEHAVLHLLYSRFVVKVLCDAGYVSVTEPFKRLFTQGMICKRSYTCTRCGKVVTDAPAVTEPCACQVGADMHKRLEEEIEVSSRVEKMSKSKGNVVRFDKVIDRYGADTLRCYTLAIGPPEKDAEWQEGGIVGYHRFLNRLWDAVVRYEGAYGVVPQRSIDCGSLSAQAKDVYQLTHQTTRKVTEDIEQRWHFNTAVAAIMELFNAVSGMDLPDSYTGTETQEGLQDFAVYRFALERMVRLLAPFVPHIAEELWTRLGNAPTIFAQGWPGYDEEAAKAGQVEIPVLVNGKLRGRIVVPRDESEDVVRHHALALEGVTRHTEGKEIARVVVVPNRTVNVVAK